MIEDRATAERSTGCQGMRATLGFIVRLCGVLPVEFCSLERKSTHWRGNVMLVFGIRAGLEDDDSNTWIILLQA